MLACYVEDALTLLRLNWVLNPGMLIATSTVDLAVFKMVVAFHRNQAISSQVFTMYNVD